ncbi:DUF3243 domain-containing protein [Halalkalibacillus sediminis]|uniref:DUF3243 domain-containing protein n=1 Tax=Halalkalibacillus sediminis TaxID=2018042 RepID=A0A2I0QWK0_9BACI|nr:DUF3243 domain-containing protein [Halalkalibacillus sediminis]PKR78684.1 DUF3243 domain-containing protein [Halalkalibacillus sediminis]
MSVLDNFDQWKDFLGDRLHQAQEKGVEQQTINQLAYEVGEHLATKVESHNEEEALLRDLWNVASEDERHAMASIMVKMVQDEGTVK